jgi:hypothetical protein
MYGGAYTFVPNVVGSSKIAVPESSYTGCGAGAYAVQNPLNQGNFPASVLTAPPGLVPNPSPGSPFMLQKGGAGSYAVDAMVYEAPRSGYSDGPSSGPTSAGPPFLVHTPYSPQPMPSSACLKTGGSRKMKKTRKNRKNRKNTRKNRKSSRKNCPYKRKKRNTRRK